MRKLVIIIGLLMGVGVCAYAIDSPAYQSPLMQSGVYASEFGGGTTTLDYNGGGSNNSGNGSFGGGDNGAGGGGYTPSGPRRALSVDGSGNLVGSPDATWEYNGVTYGYDNNGNVYFWDDRYEEWSQLANTNPGDVGAPFSPIGSPVLPMLFFALLAAGAVFLRRRRALQA